jgi:hypothetical protein
MILLVENGANQCSNYRRYLNQPNGYLDEIRIITFHGYMRYEHE